MRDVHPSDIILGLAALTLSSCLAGCDNFCDTCGPPCSQERIVGQVTGAAGPVEDASVRVLSTPYSSDYQLEIATRTDADGRFDIGVPVGRYFVSILAMSTYATMWYSSQGPTSSVAEAETLRVVEGIGGVRADFILGGLDLCLQIPPELDGWSARCRVQGMPGANTVADFTQVAELPELRFTFDNLPPGAHAVEMFFESEEPDCWSVMWLHSSMSFPGADSFVVVPREMTSWEGTLPSPGYLSGGVEGCWEETGVNTPTIQVYGPDGRRIASCQTDAEGQFDIAVFAAAQVRISVRTAESTFWLNDDSGDAEEFDVAPGTTVNVDAILLACIRCNLVGLPEWEPYSAQIEISDEVGRGVARVYLWNELTSPVVHLAPGTYFLKIMPYQPQPWRPQWYDRSPTEGGATPVTFIADSEVMELDVILEEGGKIRGRVLDENGDPVEDVRLEVRGIVGHWYWSGKWQTESDGTFLVGGLPDDDFLIGAVHTNGLVYWVTWYPGTANIDSAEVITIIDAEEVTGIEWQLLP